MAEKAYKNSRQGQHHTALNPKGFATNQRADSAAKELDGSDNAIKYGRPFYLNN